MLIASYDRYPAAEKDPQALLTGVCLDVMLQTCQGREVGAHRGRSDRPGMPMDIDTVCAERDEAQRPMPVTRACPSEHHCLGAGPGDHDLELRIRDATLSWKQIDRLSTDHMNQFRAMG